MFTVSYVYFIHCPSQLKGKVERQLTVLNEGAADQIPLDIEQLYMEKPRFTTVPRLKMVQEKCPLEIRYRYDTIKSHSLDIIKTSSLNEMFYEKFTFPNIKHLHLFLGFRHRDDCLLEPVLGFLSRNTSLVSLSLEMYAFQFSILKVLLDNHKHLKRLHIKTIFSDVSDAEFEEFKCRTPWLEIQVSVSKRGLMRFF